MDTPFVDTAWWIPLLVPLEGTSDHASSEFLLPCNILMPLQSLWLELLTKDLGLTIYCGLLRLVSGITWRVSRPIDLWPFKPDWEFPNLFFFVFYLALSNSYEVVLLCALLRSFALYCSLCAFEFALLLSFALLCALGIRKGGAKRIVRFWGGKCTIKCPLQNQFWRPQKMGFIWSVPVSSMENDIA